MGEGERGRWPSGEWERVSGGGGHLVSGRGDPSGEWGRWPSGDGRGM